MVFKEPKFLAKPWTCLWYSLVLSEEDIIGIREIEKQYLRPDFIYGKNPKFTIKRKGKSEAGIIEISIELKNNFVKNINMLGDFFLIEDEDEFLNSTSSFRSFNDFFTSSKGNFEEKVIIQKHPAFGFVRFYLADFNNDGRMDIVTTNGDNGDIPGKP